MDFGIQLNSTSVVIIMAVMITYFVAITIFGTYFSKYSKDINDFFFSGQRFPWWMSAASMVATGIGSYSYLKYSEQGFNTGMSGTLTYLNDWFIVPFFMFGWLPIIYFSRVHSVPEYFERRFNRTARYIAVAIILAYMLFYIGYNLYTIGIALEGMFGVPQIYSIPLVTLIMGLYVTTGGQTAVIFTDLVQGIMLYLAGGIAIIAGLIALGGLGEWWEWLPLTHRLPFPELIASPKFNTAGLFWGEALAGSIAFTFMNQGFIMRYLTIKSVNDGRKAALFNILCSLPISAVIVGAVGWVGKSLVTKQAASGGVLEGLDPIHIHNTFNTFIIVAWETLQHNSWVFGFVVAALTAALMSTVDTLINACAAISIYDIYKPLIKPEASDKHYLKAARISSIITTVIGLLLVIWFNQQKGSLMSIHYKGIMVIIPSIVTTIFLGAFWRRFTAIAACVSMITGSVLTIITLSYPHLIDPLSSFVFGPKNEAYIYMRALFGMSATAVIGVIVSLFTQPPSKEKIKGLTIDTLDDAMESYKGGKPNHTIGEKLRAMPHEVDSKIPEGLISLSPAMMKRMSANEGDMVYIEDSRWYLGGLRSLHVKLAPAHKKGGDTVLMSQKTRNDAYIEPHRKVTLEKIF